MANLKPKDFLPVRRVVSVAPVAALLFLSSAGARASTGLDFIDSNTNLTFYGDLRLRYEVDWDSHTAGGAERDDRNRARIRARAGLNYALADDWSTGVRLRTGNYASQQSPHLTFASDEGGSDDLSFVVDRYFVQYKQGGLYAWGGRNLWPFWEPHELFWDEDVTPTGLALGWETPLGEGKLGATAGGFYLPDGGYGLNGQMVGGQLKASQPFGSSQFTVAGAIHYFHGEDEAHNLRNRNGDRDYLLGVGNVQWGVPLKENLPLSLGADVFYNFLDYDAADVAPFPATDTDQKLGYVFYLQVGQLKQKYDWLVGYYYAHIETFSVNASYAQDDWHRFGSAAQTDSSDFEGHEVRLGYALSKNINVLARLFLVEAITTPQDGNRFRLDLNWRF